MKIDEDENLIPVDKVYQDALTPEMQQIGKVLEVLRKRLDFYWLRWSI